MARTPLRSCCSRDVHDALLADPAAFVTLPLVGYQEVEANGGAPADVLELRSCALCHSPLSRSLGAPIRAQLARARREDNIAMIACCRGALHGEVSALAALFHGMVLSPVSIS